MDMMQSVANLSMDMSSSNTNVSVNTAVMKKALDTQKTLSADILGSLNSTVDAAKVFPGENGYLFSATA